MGGKYCFHCGDNIKRNKAEGKKAYNRRKFCSVKCYWGYRRNKPIPKINLARFWIDRTK